MYISNSSYWYASRYCYSVDKELDIAVSYVNYGRTYRHNICTINSNGSITIDGYSDGLRPCISLKSNIIKITGGDGKEGNPYIIGK